MLMVEYIPERQLHLIMEVRMDFSLHDPVKIDLLDLKEKQIRKEELVFILELHKLIHHSSSLHQDTLFLD